MFKSVMQWKQARKLVMAVVNSSNRLGESYSDAREIERPSFAKTCSLKFHQYFPSPEDCSEEFRTSGSDLAEAIDEEEVRVARVNQLLVTVAKGLSVELELGGTEHQKRVCK